MQSLAGDKGIRRGDIAAPAFPWRVRAGRPSGFWWRGTQDRAPGSAPASLVLFRGRGVACRAGEHSGTGREWEHGHCHPRGVSGLPRAWVFPTFLPGFISWGLASFPAQEEHIKNPQLNNKGGKRNQNMTPPQSWGEPGQVPGEPVGRSAMARPGQVLSPGDSGVCSSELLVDLLLVLV